VLGKECAWKKKPSMEKLQKMSEKHGNIIQYMQMWILDDFGFSRCTVLLYITIVIFRKRILTGSGA